MSKKNKNELFFTVDEDKVKAKFSFKKLTGWLFMPLAIFFFEVTSYYFLYGTSVSTGLLFCLASSIAFGLLFDLFISLFSHKAQRIITILLLIVLIFYFSGILIYYAIFHSFFLWQTIGLAADVTDFYREAIEGILENWYKPATMFIPVLIYLFYFRKKKVNPIKYSRLLAIIVIAGISAGLVFNMHFSSGRKIVLHMNDDTASTYYQYGVLTSTMVDLSQLAFGVGEDDVDNPFNQSNSASFGKTDVTVSEGKLILKNALDIDFEAMIAATNNSTIKNMHEYFASKPATEQNEYTGMFEGYNLIFLSLEGFSYKVIDPEITPTLYKMYSEGFQFVNFYDSLWGGSTATGEYANMTGNFYTNASCIANSANTLTYSAMGNLFKNAGYHNYAFHNHSYSYYGRDKSHPNFGYANYKGIGNGLQLQHYRWPNSDYEMAVSSLKDYINSDEPFHVYYMTVSGHTNYTFTGNNMANIHYGDVINLNIPDSIKPYVGTQLEVEKALTYLVEQLEAAGKLDKTVFAMCCDHYPYGLSDQGLADLYGLPVKDIRINFELFRNGFILWNSKMEGPIVIDEPCGSYDIVPTLANLFAIPYDSRFITGTDILSSTENICIINTTNSNGGNWNWITKQGTYYVISKKFVPSETCTLSEEEINSYVEMTNTKVNAMRKYSLAILDNDYYRYVFNKDGSPKYPLDN